jgi:LPXTG-motif cell wall-anchored protein
MRIKAIIGLVLLAVGAMLLYFGLQATDAPLERARETLTGDYSDQTMLYLIGGGAAAVAGLALLVFGRRR